MSERPRVSMQWPQSFQFKTSRTHCAIFSKMVFSEVMSSTTMFFHCNLVLIQVPAAANICQNPGVGKFVQLKHASLDGFCLAKWCFLPTVSKLISLESFLDGNLPLVGLLLAIDKFCSIRGIHIVIFF